VIFKIIKLSNLEVLFGTTVVDVTPSAPEGYLSIEIPEGLNENYVKAELINDVVTLVEDPVAKKSYLIAAAKAAMWTDVLAAMETTYGTTDMNSAQALQAMWTELEANPTLNISAVFPTVEAIAAYVTPRMILGRQYLAYNLGRRAQFEQEKSAILAQ
jgi:hypothetical protein